VLNKTSSARGNIFAMLFAAVGLTGALGVVGMQTISGPVTTMTKVTQKNITDNDVMVNGRIVILNAATLAKNISDNPGPADAAWDGDYEIEPIAFVPQTDPSCTVAPTGGGCLPSGIGAILTDPWGTPYGYCAWDHGSNTSTTNMLAGSANSDGAAVAIISAGPDRAFNTLCAAHAGNADNMVQTTSGSDDIAKVFTYQEAVAGAGGLWDLVSGNVGALDSSVDTLQIGSNATFDVTTGIGDFFGLTVDQILSKTGEVIELEGALILDNAGTTSADTCGAGDAGAIRLNATLDAIEICDGAGAWTTASGADQWRIIDEDHGSNTYVTVAGTDNSANTDVISFVTAGTERVVVDASGNVGIGTASPAVKLHVDGGVARFSSTTSNWLDIDANSGSGNDVVLSTRFNSMWFNVPSGAAANYFAWQTDGVNRMRLTSAGRLGIGTTLPGSRLDVVGDANVTTDLTVDTDTLVVDSTNNRVGIGTLSPGALLDVAMPSQLSIPAFRVDGITAAAYLAEIDQSGGNRHAMLVRHSNPAGNGKTLVVQNVGSSGNLFDAYRNNTRRFSIEADGDVGIKLGNATPQSALHVAGAIQMSSGTCSGTTEGAIQYTSANNIQYCNGSSWQTITGAVAQLRDIGNVDITADPTNGYVLQWDNTAKDWNAVDPTSLTSGSATNADSSGEVIDGDNDTWIRVEDDSSNDNDIIRMATSGTERMVITDTGRIGIGTDAPLGTAEIYAGAATNTVLMLRSDLSESAYIEFREGTRRWATGPMIADVAGLGGRYAVAAYRSGSNYLPGIVLDGSGNVAVGHTAPNVRLHAEQDSPSADSVSSVLRVTSTNDGTGTIGAGIGVGMEFEVETAADNNEIGAVIEAVTTDVIATTEDFDLVFKTMAGGATADEAIRITGDNRVGIGTTTPAATLEVAGTDSILFPRGTVAQRPSTPVNGMMRYNSDNDRYEAYQGGAWQDILTDAAVASLTLADADGDTRIQVEETTDDDTIRFDTDGSERMVIDSTGNVGIGTGTPSGVLTVARDESASGGGDDSQIQILSSNGGNILAGYVIGGIDFLANDLGNIANTAQIRAIAKDGHVDGVVRDTGLSFSTTSGTALAERMVIDASGNVGIGTNTPDSLLELQSSGANALITLDSTTVGGLTMKNDATSVASISYLQAGGFLRFRSGDDTTDDMTISSTGGTTLFPALATGLTINRPSNNLYSSVVINRFDSDRDDRYAILVQDESSNGLFALTGNGNVGIGTATPAATLEVAGTDSILFPRGTAANRPSVPVNGMMRYNSDNGKFEAYQGGVWQDILTDAAVASLTLADADNDTLIQVEESSDEDIIRFDTAGTERMVIDASGNVGIGTDSPSAALDINVIGANLKLGSNGSGSPSISFREHQVMSYYQNRPLMPGLYLGAPNVIDSSYLLQINASAGVNGIIGRNNGTYNLLAMDGGALNIDSLGNAHFLGSVGVGTNSPDLKLHAENDSAANNSVSSVVRLTSTNDGTGTIAAGIGVGMEFEVETSADNNEIGAVIEAVTTDVTATSEDFDLVFKTMGAGATASEKARITANGQLIVDSGGTVDGHEIGRLGVNYDSSGAPSIFSTGGSVIYAEDQLHFNRTGQSTLAADRRTASTLRIEHARTGQDIAFRTAPTTNDVLVEAMRINSAGNVGIGTTTPDDGVVEVKGGTVCVDTNSDDSATSCITSESDIRLKKNISVIEGALAKIDALRGVMFDWRWDEYEQIGRYKAKPNDVGVIAQEVEAVLPEAMDEEIGGFKTVSYDRLVPLLIEGVKALKGMIDSIYANIESLFGRVSALEKENTTLRAEIEALKAQNQDILNRLEQLENE